VVLVSGRRFFALFSSLEGQTSITGLGEIILLTGDFGVTSLIGALAWDEWIVHPCFEA